MMNKTIKHMDIKEFREQGFLQEANRLYFHPLGLALEVAINHDGSESLGDIWDYRDDPEGMLFGKNMIDPKKSNNIKKLLESKRITRTKLLGKIIQSN